MSGVCAFNDLMSKNSANYVSLSPLSFIKRAASVYPNRKAVVYNEIEYSWSETYKRCCKLASALKRLGVSRGDVVATMLPNVPAMYEAHFGIPMVGAVINAINIRLDAAAVAFILSHSKTKVLLVDPELAGVVSKALSLLEGRSPVVINVRDDSYTQGSEVGDLEYETLLDAETDVGGWQLPSDEWDAIALGYTSGTTGDPKGVVTHHRGAYLNAVSNVLSWSLPQEVTYLWTLPLFHCNGWCFPWTMAAIAGTNVCLRRVDAKQIVALIKRHGVTHYCGAPIVHSMIADAVQGGVDEFSHKVHGLIAGAAPPASILERMENIGFDLTHVYGLTETYGPAAVCAKHADWDNLPLEQRVLLNGRQGVAYPLQEEVAVLDPETLLPVPFDGETVGEIMFKGNIVMKGYLENEKATKEAFSGGWFHSGDLAVVHPDGYLKITDRLKDIIISGGENISSLEVESVIDSHPSVHMVAVVAMPDSKWGEVPAAFVQLRDGCAVSEAELISYCKERLASFKTPKKIIFENLQTTSTGKIQKFHLRQKLAGAA
ncbi:acyl-CoA synthetase [Pseudomonas zhanjiangensis]|uniref:Acyl-CoA synthetase n=1 Tax=Pseudomonas zhanjiangensis TaxID=3239015 RepID=A0ABV3YZU5_9PSED